VTAPAAAGFVAAPAAGVAPAAGAVAAPAAGVTAGAAGAGLVAAGAGVGAAAGLVGAAVGLGAPPQAARIGTATTASPARKKLRRPAIRVTSPPILCRWGRYLTAPPVMPCTKWSRKKL
jgi:hypothetical protein